MLFGGDKEVFIYFIYLCNLSDVSYMQYSAKNQGKIYNTLYVDKIDAASSTSCILSTLFRGEQLEIRKK